MTAPNHALTGALIGLSVANPALALPLAFLSHFVLDAIPHYNPPETDMVALFRSKRFVWEFLVLGAGVCLLLVVVLALARPAHWLSAAWCAFVATSPDLLWIPRFMTARRSGKDVDVSHSNLFWRFHDRIQWKTGPKLIWLEAIWFVGMCLLLATRL